MTPGIKLAVGALREPLEQEGFRKRSGEIFTITVADDVLGWLGLNYSTHRRSPGQAAVHPFVGVRHQGVERLVATLRREEYHQYLPPTAGTLIGYVMPVNRDIGWQFGGPHGTSEKTGLLAAVVDYGLPFMRSLIRLPAILDAINQGLCLYPEYRFPAVLEVMGRHDDARAAMARAIGELGQRDDAAAQQLRAFAAELAASTPP